MTCYYFVCVKYLPMPALPELTLTIQAHDEEEAQYKAKLKACKKWDLYTSAMPLMTVTFIARGPK